MNFLLELLTVDSVAHAIFILALVVALGLIVGKVRIFGIQIGLIGVLFAGLIFGHYKITIHPQVLDFIREFGLVLFVYTIGIQVGPGFMASLRREGLKLNLMAAAVVVLGVLMTVLISSFGHINMEVAVGMLSGATTNTPSLAAAQQTLKDIGETSGEVLKLPGIGYAISYPFGVIGTILSIVLIRVIFKINPKKEAEAHVKSYEGAQTPSTLNIEIQNHNLNGLAIKNIPTLEESGIVISRLLQGNVLQVPLPETKLQIGDVILAVGPKNKLEEFLIVVGRESKIDLRMMRSNIVTKDVVVTKKNVIGQTIEELYLLKRYGVTITRVIRTEIEFTASADVVLQFGDVLRVVGEEEDIKQAAVELGNSPKELDHPNIIPIFVGIILGVIVGSWPIHFPGAHAPIKLGLAGGPLVVAILLSYLGRLGPFIWYMPKTSNLMLREVGIALFLSCVGLRSGDQFLQTLFEGQGFVWMGYAILITMIPLIIVGFIARMNSKLNFMSICGLLAGSMTDPPALAFANSIVTSNAPSISYATVYPLVMLMRVISAQILILSFLG